MSYGKASLRKLVGWFVNDKIYLTRLRMISALLKRLTEFGASGGGIQFRLDDPIDRLISLGFLELLP